jgi:ribosome-associated protein
MDKLEELKNFIVAKLEDRKASDIAIIDLSGKTDIASYMIFANGRSNKNVASMAEFLSLELKNQIGLDVGLEGFQQSDWVLIDAGSIIVHIFHPEARLHYKLEEYWGRNIKPNLEILS